MPLYENNLAALEERNPLLAFQLLTASGRQKRKGTLPFKNSSAEVVYLLGLEGEKRLEQSLKWVNLDQKRYLALLDEDLHSFQEFLSKNIAKEIVNHPRILLAAPPFDETLKSFVWNHLYKPWECIGDEATRRKVGDLILGVESTVSLYREYGTPQLMNVFANLLSSDGILRGETLFARFSNIPAIICGAGPSLDESIEELKTLENRALIFGGGSSLLPLSQAGVPLHFAAALDPDPPHDRFLQQTHFEVPLFYQNQLSHTLFSESHGPKLCVGESGGFPLEGELNLELSPCDVGWNVATFATQIAYQLGCNPIIFVGMDLCVSESRAYAGGMNEVRENNIECTDRFGNTVSTRPDFLMAKKWLEAFAHTHTERLFINASKGGLALEGVQDGPLDGLKAPCDLTSKVQAAIAQASKLKVSEASERIEEFYASACRCAELLEANLHPLLDSEVFYQKHLIPNWEVWKHFLQKEEIIAAMQYPEMEKKLQQTLFLKEVTETFRREYERMLST